MKINPNYPLTLYYDGACPLCALEMDHLRERDRHGRLRIVDIAAPGFAADPSAPTRAELDSAIHAQRPDGRWLHGVEVIRLAYDAVGLGAWLKPTGWAPIRPLADAGYLLFARHRQAISRTAKPLLDTVTALRAARVQRRMAACAGGACSTTKRSDR